MLTHPKHGSLDQVALRPLDDHRPHYCRDAEFFIGSLEELEVWLHGYEWAENYYSMLKLIDIKKIIRREDAYRQSRFFKKLKGVEEKTA
jgi:hypothetical protein